MAAKWTQYLALCSAIVLGAAARLDPDAVGEGHQVTLAVPLYPSMTRPNMQREAALWP